MPNKERLLQLAEHLNNGVLGHKVFNFNYYNSNAATALGHKQPIKPNSCGTMGCAIGECPIVWPNDWWFNNSGAPVLIHGLDLYTTTCAMEWFGITMEEYRHLFIPEGSKPAIFGGKWLGEDATRYEVADNIIAFVALLP